MSKEVKLNDDDLKKANGGTFFVKTWICPVCGERYEKGSFPAYKTEKSDTFLYCTKCQEWYRKNEWKHINYR